MGKRKTIVCLETGKQFNSVENAANAIGVSSGFISRQIKIGDAAAKLHLNARKLGNAIRENEPYHGLHFFLIAESWQDETK